MIFRARQWSRCPRVTLQQDRQALAQMLHPYAIEGVDHLERAIRLPPFLGERIEPRNLSGIRRPGGRGRQPSDIFAQHLIASMTKGRAARVEPSLCRNPLPVARWAREKSALLHGQPAAEHRAPLHRERHAAVEHFNQRDAGEGWRRITDLRRPVLDARPARHQAG